MSNWMLMFLSKLCIVPLTTFWVMATRTFRLLMGAALLTTLVACQGRMSRMDSEEATPAASEDTMEMASEEMGMHSEEEAHDHMDMGEPVFSGTFQKGKYKGAGTFKIYKDGDVTRLHLSEDFESNPKAPDLYLVIGNSTNPIDGKKNPYPLEEDEYMTVAELTSAMGAQKYEIPADIDLSEDSSVIIWCKEVNATMSYAPVEAASMAMPMN